MAENDTRAARRALAPDLAPEQPAKAEIGLDLLCENFETGGAVLGKVIGRDGKGNVRLRLESGNEWVVREQRIDLAKRTWQHVAADYPSKASDPAFDAEFRSTPAEKAVAEDPSRTAALKDLGLKLADHLPPELREGLERLLRTATGKSGGPVPTGSVYAKWVHPGKLDAPIVKAGTREMVRGVANGDEGFFDRTTFEKYRQRGKRQGVAYIVEL